MTDERVNPPGAPIRDLIDRVIVPALLARLLCEQAAPKPKAA
jgi:hypothetical protein